jgi:hypothetical protein
MPTEKFDETGKPVLVKVGAVDYTVEWYDEYQFRARNAFGQGDHLYAKLGACNFLKPQAMAVAFLHEVTHALHFGSSASQDKELDVEHIAELVSNGLAAFWRDNPGTMQWVGAQLMSEG